jgi:dienelactone hydrolase
MTDFTEGGALYGSFDVLQESVTVGGFEMADYYGEVNEDAGVWRPDTDGKFPLISFSHGFGMGNEGVYGHSPLLNDVASAGYIVVAHKSAGFTGMGDFSQDQLRTIEWARDSELSEFIDWDAPTGVMGYSMGGGATLTSASNQPAIDEFNIGVAVAVAPMTNEVSAFFNEALAAYGEETFDAWDIGVPVIPTLYAVGDIDQVCPAVHIFANYETSTAPKVWANLAGADHLEIAYPEQRWSYAVMSMLNCHLKGDSEGCNVMYNNVASAETDAESVCHICDCPERIELSECMFDGATMLGSGLATAMLAMALWY